MRLFLCEARERKRSILGVCEEPDYRKAMQNLPFRTSCQKIVNDEIIFVRGQGAKAEHTLRYVSISLSAGSCKKNSSERFLIVLCLNLKVSLRVSTYRANLRCLLAYYDVAAV